MKDTFSIDNLPEAFDLAVGLGTIGFRVDMLDTNDSKHSFKEMPALGFLTRERGEFNTIVRHDTFGSKAVGQKELHAVKERSGDLGCCVG